jgi:hypothetical protein
MRVEPEKLKSVLGIADVTFIPGRSALAIVDATPKMQGKIVVQ